MQGGAELLDIKDADEQTAGDIAAAKAKALCARTVLSILPRLMAALPRLLLLFYWYPCTITPGLDTQVRHGRGKGYCHGNCGSTRNG